MPMIPKEVLEQIRLHSDIVEVVGKYVQLQRAGSRFRALCPFHKEKTPSFFVQPDRQIFHCFGCGAGGDVFRFVMDHEGVDFMTGVRMLADRAGIRLDIDKTHTRSGIDKDTLYDIHSKIARDYQRALLESPAAAEARDYLLKRKLSPEIVDTFLIGFAPDKWDAMRAWADKNKFSLPQMQAAGLILESDRKTGSSRFYDRFRNRLMFPIHDELGRVVAFSGRTLSAESNTAKYVNSPETPLFRKSRLLYAMHKARKPIVDAREAVVCEGQIDVIRCHQAGITTAVAPQGTAATEDHARILKRYADSVVLVFDADKAGQDAAIRTADIFFGAGLVTRVAQLPQGEDPDSFILTNGPDAFRELLGNAGSALDYQIDVLQTREDSRTEVGLMRMTRTLLESVSRSPDVVHQEEMIERICRRLNLPLDRVREMRRLLRRSPKQLDKVLPTQPTTESPKEELALAEHLAREPDLLDLVRRYVPLSMLSSTLCRTFVECLFAARDSGQEPAAVLSERDDESRALSEFAAGIQMAPARVRGDEYSQEEAIKHLILLLWRRDLRRNRAEIAEKLQTGQDTEQSDTLQDEHQQLTVELRMLDTWDTAVPIMESTDAAPADNAVAREQDPAPGN